MEGMDMIMWDAHASINGTSLRGYLRTPWSFEETVARLVTLSGQDPTARTDGYKVSVEFTGLFGGDVFTLYDYKGGGCLHVGGRSLDVKALETELVSLLRTVEPTPYSATINYDESAGATHGWGAPELTGPKSTGGLDDAHDLLASFIDGHPASADEKRDARKALAKLARLSLGA
jgi:hypothetical protein